MIFPKTTEFKQYFDDEIWREAAKIIGARHRLEFQNMKRAEHGENIVFLLDEKYVIKIYVPEKNGAEREKNSLELARTSFPIPEIIGCGELENFKYLFMTQLQGELMTKEMWFKISKTEQISVLSQLAEGLKILHRTDKSRVDFNWRKFVERQAESCLERQKKCQVNAEILARIPSYLEENLSLLPKNYPEVFMHGDVHFGNLRVQNRNGKWKISGLFDFADSLKGFHEYEFLAVGLLMIQGQGELQREFFRFFGYADSEIDENLRKRLMLLTMFYEWSDLRRYAVRLRPEAVNYSLDKLEREIWNFI